MRLHDLRSAPGSRKRRTRVGRGPSAGQGKTSGRGQKGQGARTSWNLPRAFEGGQMPLSQRVPKLRGFHNRFRVEYEVVNCVKLRRFAPGSTVDPASLAAAGLIAGERRRVKLLAVGQPPEGLVIRVHRASAAAQRAVAAAGGRVELIEAELAAAAPDADGGENAGATPADR